MRGEVLFEKMTGISDEYIQEAALVAPVGVAAPRKKPFASLSTAWRRGLSAACICLIVAITAAACLVAWEPIRDFIEQGNHPSGRFTFYYQTESPGSKLCTALPGDTVYVDTGIQNEGKAFEASNFFARAHFVLQSDPSVVLEGEPYPLNEDAHAAVRTIKSGYRENMPFTFIIPEDAVLGVYDLVLSYGEEQQVYKGVLTVGEAEGETQPPEDTIDRYGFSFGYELAGDALTGTPYYMDTWVVNEGASFTFEGSSMGFAPSAVLIHMETQYRIEGAFDLPTDYTTVTVNTGDKGQITQEFLIPADAPTGAYALQLSYGGVSKSFAGVVIVAEPTVEVPAVLYNLTMSIGSDWLYEPIDEAYVDGELVTVRIKFATDVGTLFILNGEVIDAVTGDDQLGYWEYSFIMPKKDSEIIFHTYDGTAPYAEMLKAFILSNPYLFAGEEQFYYYGEFGDGVMVALQLGYGEAIWSTAVGGYTFVTPNTHDMMAFRNGTLYELQTAYDMGLLTDGDLEVMMATHKEWFPHY